MANDQAPMTNHAIQKERVFDLAERIAAFGENAVHFSTTIRRDAVTMPLISQFVRSSTSIGANYLEADEAGSKKEFRYRISVCRREARETKNWLRMLVAASPEIAEPARKLWQEAREFVLILESIHRKAAAMPK
ncbi:MAG: four helix bundle protein [Pirellulales bacterium]